MKIRENKVSYEAVNAYFHQFNEAASAIQFSTNSTSATQNRLTFVNKVNEVNTIQAVVYEHKQHVEQRVETC